jgi:hypothetical protein
MAPGIMCFGRKPEDPESRRNEEIEKGIRNDRRKQEREVKLLLLGMLARHGRYQYQALTEAQVLERVASRPC